MTIPHLAEPAVLATGGLAVVATGALVGLSFTAADISTLTIAAATLITALFGGVALLITTVRSTRKSVDQNSAKLAENTELTREVAVKVDGQASKREEENASLREELKWLRERIGEQRQDAALLAQAAATPTLVTLPISATNILNGSEEHLEKISEDTDAIKHNTAKP